MFLKYLSVFLISMVPLVELRGAIPFATVSLGLAYWPSLAVCVLGNLFPVPLIYFFARKVLEWGQDKRGMFLALLLFVGIPLPGTGAWTGTLAASFLDFGIKGTSVAVSLGVVLAGIIMGVISMTGIHVFGL